MTKSLLFAIGLVFVTTFQADTQTLPPPPNVLLIVREEIKPGMMAAHSREANNVVRIYSKAKSPYNRLAMVPVAGNENEVTYLWPFDSFAELEKSNKDLETLSTVTYKADFEKVRPEGDDYHSSQRDMIAVLRNDLSYNGGADMPRMRYMRVQTVRVKPGHSREFEESRRMTKAAHEKARIDENMAVYQVVGGAQSGTYLIFIPWDSLTRAETIPHGKSYQDALGEDRRDKIEKIENDSIVFSATEIYAFNPQLSFAPRFAAADPGFWTLKPMAPESTAPTAAKSRQKTMGKKP